MHCIQLNFEKVFCGFDQDATHRVLNNVFIFTFSLKGLETPIFQTPDSTQ